MSMDKIKIRRANPADAGILVNFNREIALETEGKELDQEIVTSGVQALLGNDALGFYVVAENDGGIAGSLMITTEWSDWRNGDFWWIQSVYVKPACRQQGIYRALHEFVRNMADRDPTVCGFRLYVERENTIAQNTYRSLGMHETSYRLFEELNAKSP
jgi:ribosomal protein S18 acetylase RimI-like enzyme